ncbi:MAG: hypothetical protein PF961_02315 [Planctomycetota bacterium]|nr:hypothetical protein [Planctomycetota bacterium]
MKYTSLLASRKPWATCSRHYRHAHPYREAQRRLDHGRIAAHLATLATVIGESHHLPEWQGGLAGMITWVLDSTGEQRVATAARFGRSFATGD